MTANATRPRQEHEELVLTVGPPAHGGHCVARPADDPSGRADPVRPKATRPGAARPGVGTTRSSPTRPGVGTTGATRPRPGAARNSPTRPRAVSTASGRGAGPLPAHQAPPPTPR